MGRNRKCNWKRKKAKAEKKLNKNKPISGLDYWRLCLDTKNHNDKFWDDMYKQYVDAGSNFIMMKSRRRSWNFDMVVKMAEEFYKRSPLVFAPAKLNENMEGLSGKPFDYINTLYGGRDPDLPYFRTPKEKEDFDLLFNSVFPKRITSLSKPIIFGTGGDDSGRFSSYQLLDEFSNYGKNWKAERVYQKCIRNRKLILADKIAEKYNLKIVHDDRVMAFALSLESLKHIKNEK